MRRPALALCEVARAIEESGIETEILWIGNQAVRGCIGCGMCSAACPWNMPHINAQTGTSTKCISCGRCAEQCPNGAIKFIDWEDIAQKAIDEGVVSTATIVEA